MKQVVAVPLPPDHESGLVSELMMQMAYCDPAIETYELVSAAAGPELQVTVTDGGSAKDVERKVTVLARRVFSAGRGAPTIVTERSFEPKNHVDVEGELRRRGLVVKAGPGLYHLSGLGLGLFTFFDSKFRDLALRLGAVEEHYPPVIAISALKRIGFFESTPQYATFVSHLREDMELIDAFADDMKRGPAVVPSGHPSVADCEYALASTVCCHTFSGRVDSPIAGDTVVTARNICTRYEAKNLAHLDRLWTFNMREIVFVGETAKFAEDGRTAVLGEVERLLERYQLSYRVERANDLFFAADVGNRTRFQRGLGLKLELRLLVPPTQTSVACGSFNLHQTNFGRKAAIVGRTGKPVHSSCVGFGIERWVYCFLQQYGLEPERWPADIRRALRV